MADSKKRPLKSGFPVLWVSKPSQTGVPYLEKSPVGFNGCPTFPTRPCAKHGQVAPIKKKLKPKQNTYSPLTVSSPGPLHPKPTLKPPEPGLKSTLHQPRPCTNHPPAPRCLPHATQQRRWRRSGLAKNCPIGPIWGIQPSAAGPMATQDNFTSVSRSACSLL